MRAYIFQVQIHWSVLPEVNVRVSLMKCLSLHHPQQRKPLVPLWSDITSQAPQPVPPQPLLQGSRHIFNEESLPLGPQMLFFPLAPTPSFYDMF